MVRKSQGSDRAVRRIGGKIKAASGAATPRHGVRVPRDEQVRRYIYGETTFMRAVVGEDGWRRYEREMQKKLKAMQAFRRKGERGF